MADLKKLKTTLVYARLGLVSLSAIAVPITSTAQELCGMDLFAGEPDAASLMATTLEFIDILEANGVVAFQGSEGSVPIGSVRSALLDGVGSATLLSCVVNAQAIQVSNGTSDQLVNCNAGGLPRTLLAGSAGSSSPSGQLFCTTEVATTSQYLGSEA